MRIGQGPAGRLRRARRARGPLAGSGSHGQAPRCEALGGSRVSSFLLRGSSGAEGGHAEVLPTVLSW